MGTAGLRVFRLVDLLAHLLIDEVVADPMKHWLDPTSLDRLSYSRHVAQGDRSLGQESSDTGQAHESNLLF